MPRLYRIRKMYVQYVQVEMEMMIRSVSTYMHAPTRGKRHAPLSCITRSFTLISRDGTDSAPSSDPARLRSHDSSLVGQSQTISNQLESIQTRQLVSAGRQYIRQASSLAPLHMSTISGRWRVCAQCASVQTPSAASHYQCILPSRDPTHP